MTPEWIAERVCGMMPGEGRTGVGREAVVASWVREAAREAVAAERERCLAVARELIAGEWDDPDGFDVFARRVRKP